MSRPSKKQLQRGRLNKYDPILGFHSARLIRALSSSPVRYLCIKCKKSQVTQEVKVCPACS